MSTPTPTTASVEVEVYGPNLPGKLNGQMIAHRPGCADTKKGVYARSRVEPPWSATISSYQDLVLSCYSDQIAESEDGDWEAYTTDVVMMPCVGELPYADGEDGQEAKAERRPAMPVEDRFHWVVRHKPTGEIVKQGAAARLYDAKQRIGREMSSKTQATVERHGRPVLTGTVRRGQLVWSEVEAS